MVFAVNTGLSPTIKGRNFDGIIRDGFQKNWSLPYLS